MMRSKILLLLILFIPLSLSIDAKKPNSKRKSKAKTEKVVKKKSKNKHPEAKKVDKTPVLKPMIKAVTMYQQDSIRQSLQLKSYGVKPWVRLVSRPNKITNGLAGRHVTIWPSHGRYYNQAERKWKWQRPKIFGTCEDLFTQSIVNPYLLPMLQNAGCVVYVPRERDWQTEECIVDNDIMYQGYSEMDGHWKDAPRPGFMMHTGKYLDGENPFIAGKARMIRASREANALVSYRPNIKVSGEHAVYVSYQTVEKSADDAEYTVIHRGIRTVYNVNQKMGGSTWVYLGTFDFAAGDPINNCVELTNKSKNEKSWITTDAVKFGGGMGNYERGGMTSGLPRAMEGSRYWTMWAGSPHAATMSKNERDDYAEDINSRSLTSNWLSYGSAYNPVIVKKYVEKETITTDSANVSDTVKTKEPEYQMSINVTKPDEFTGHVPFELSLAIHSDAGWMNDKKSILGSLTICTTDFNGGLLPTGLPRYVNKEFAKDILSDAISDIADKYGKWNRHDFYDRNYSETRLPAQPSAIFETLSHQNFPDMKFGHDPDFKFTLARSIYKTILRTLAQEHGFNPIVEPLPAKALESWIEKDGMLRISWQPVYDRQETTASPTSYNVYMAKDDGGMDNGTNVRFHEYTVKMEPNVLYRFKVTQVNSGGESFPTEELCALYNPEATETALIINGFHRLSGPATIDTDSLQGFVLDDDIGLSYGRTPVWCGKQKVFETSKGGHGLGSSGNELMGRFFAGNDFNYATEHARAMATAKRCNIISMSSECIDATSRQINGVDMVDIILGAEKNDGHSLRPYKTFSPKMQQSLKAYSAKGGKIFASGSYMTSDMLQEDEKQFVDKVFHVQLDTIDVISNPLGDSDKSTCGEEENIKGMDMVIPMYRTVNSVHYAAPKADALLATGDNAFAALNYASGRHAAVAFNATPARTFTMGIPFECIRSFNDQATLMRSIVHFLLGERKPKAEKPAEPQEVPTKDKKKKRKNNTKH